jgi:hypothetical protein
VTHRPKWSKTSSITSALRSCARLLFAGALLGGCSALDPNIGPTRTEPDSLTDADAPDGDPEGGADPGDGFFARNIRPLMNRPGKGDPTGRGCKSCHYRTETNHSGLDLSGLDLTTLRVLRRGGGTSGTRIVVAGKPSESVLVQVLKGTYGYAARMPKNGMPYWSDDEIELVEKWIAEGAKGADDE